MLRTRRLASGMVLQCYFKNSTVMSCYFFIFLKQKHNFCFRPHCKLVGSSPPIFLRILYGSSSPRDLVCVSWSQWITSSAMYRGWMCDGVKDLQRIWGKKVGLISLRSCHVPLVTGKKLAPGINEDKIL